MKIFQSTPRGREVKLDAEWRLRGWRLRGDERG
jgi:hypothetical protein